MFSSTFALLLAGSMVSQVFSKPVLLVAFDSVNANFIADKMPDLNYNGSIGQYIARPERVKSINPTLSFPTLHTVATNRYAYTHGIVANKMFENNNKEMYHTAEQFAFSSNLKPLWIEAEKAGKRTATVNWPGANFLMHNTKPTFVEEYEYKTNADWNTRTTKIIELFTRTSDSFEFVMAYFEDTNRMEPVDSYTDRVQKAIKDIYNGLKDTDVDIIIMSTYGTKSVHKDHVLRIDDFVPKHTYHYKFIPAGPISYMRFNDQKDFSETCAQLERNSSKFSVYKADRRTSLIQWNLNSFRSIADTLIIITSNGYTFYDEKKYNDLHESGVNIIRENGYDKNDSDMDAILLLMGSSFKDNVVAQDAEIELIEVHKLTKRLLGLKTEIIVFDYFGINEDEANEKMERDIKEGKKMNELSENMRKLIEDDILRIWDGINWDIITNITPPQLKRNKNHISSGTTRVKNRT